MMGSLCFPRRWGDSGEVIPVKIFLQVLMNFLHHARDVRVLSLRTEGHVHFKELHHLNKKYRYQVSCSLFFQSRAHTHASTTFPKTRPEREVGPKS
jgi:hypothetical protein